MNTLIAMVGLPRSGKSTMAQTIAEKNTGCAIVCPDSFRVALGCYPFVKEREEEVWYHVHTTTKALLENNRLVIVDACSVTRRSREWLRKLCRPRFLIMQASPAVCIMRAQENKQEYLVPVIERMYDTWEEVTSEEGDILGNFRDLGK